MVCTVSAFKVTNTIPWAAIAHLMFACCMFFFQGTGELYGFVSRVFCIGSAVTDGRTSRGLLRAMTRVGKYHSCSSSRLHFDCFSIPYRVALTKPGERILSLPEPLLEAGPSGDTFRHKLSGDHIRKNAREFLQLLWAVRHGRK